MKKVMISVFAILIALGFYTPSTKAAEFDFGACSQYKGVKVIWWNGVELKPGQIGLLHVVKNTTLYKVTGTTKTASRTLKAGETYRIYTFQPGMLGLGAGYYVNRDTKISYQTPSKAKLQAVQCINNPYGTKKNPTVTGDVWNVKVNDPYDGYEEFKMSLVDSITDGAAAYQKLQEADSTYPAPPAGKKYVLAKFDIKLNKFQGIDTDSWYPVYFDAVSQTGVVYDDWFDPETGLQPAIDEVYEGGETQGWIAFLVNENDNPLIVWDKDYEDELWFKLK